MVVAESGQDLEDDIMIAIDYFSFLILAHANPDVLEFSTALRDLVT